MAYLYDLSGQSPQYIQELESRLSISLVMYIGILSMIWTNSP